MNARTSRYLHAISLAVIFSSLWCSTAFAKLKDIQLAVLMPAPPKVIHQNWRPLANYLSTKLGRPVKIITPRSLEEAKKAVSSVDFVYANSYLFSLLNQEEQLTAVAQMKNTGNSIYSRGRWLVRKDSSIHSAKDLKGKKIALISPNGAGSYLAPRA